MLRRCVARWQSQCGEPLAAFYGEAAPTLLLTKNKYVSAQLCHKRLYYVEEAAAMRHKAWLALRHGSAAAQQMPLALDDEGRELERGAFDVTAADPGASIPAPSGKAGPVQALAVPDEFASVLAVPPPGVLSRLADKVRLSLWAKDWHAVTARRTTTCVCVTVKGAEAAAEEMTLAHLKKVDGSKEFVVYDAVVGFTRPDGVHVRTRIDVLHYVPAASVTDSSAAAGSFKDYKAPPATEGRWYVFEFKSFVDPKPHHVAALRHTAAYHRAVLQAVGIELFAVRAVHVSRTHRRAPHVAGSRSPQLAAALCTSTLVECDADVTNLDPACNLIKEFVTQGPPQAWGLHFGLPGLVAAAPSPSAKDVVAAASKQVSLCGSQCSQCVFSARCMPKNKVLPHNVFTLPLMRTAAKVALWNSGVKSVVDVDPESLTGSQQRYQRSIAGGPQVDVAAASAFFAAIKYPLVVIDFEATAFPDPPFANLSAYDVLPFQFSADVFYSEADFLSAGGQPEHVDFLHFGPGIPVTSDPRPHVTAALMRLLRSVEATAEKRGIAPPRPNSPLRIGTMLAHNSTFEKNVLRKLELAEKRGADADGQSLYDPRYTSKDLPWLDSVDLAKAVVVSASGGSNSLKALLPAFAPDYVARHGGYTSLGRVRDGADASGVFSLYVTKWFSADDTTQHALDRDAFLRYCQIDTAGLIEVLRGAYAMLQAARQSGCGGGAVTPNTHLPPPTPRVTPSKAKKGKSAPRAVGAGAAPAACRPPQRSAPVGVRAPKPSTAKRPTHGAKGATQKKKGGTPLPSSSRRSKA